MKICLINPPFYEMFSRSQRSPAVIKSGTLYYPIWLSFAAGVLIKEGFDILLIDGVSEKYNFQDCINKIKQFEPEIIVIETSTPSIENDLCFSKELKKIFTALIVLVGTHVSVLYEEILKDNISVDIIAIGEYEYTILEIEKEYGFKKNFNNVAGIAFIENGKVIKTKSRKFISNLDDLPFLSKIYKENLNINNYYFSLALHPMVMLITGRGCPNSCIFCVYPQTMYGNEYRYRSPENIVEELEYIRKELPQVRQIVFEDDTFTANEEKVINTCEILIKKNIKIKWFANLRVNTRAETLRIMKKAGLVNCAVGFESGEQKILDKMKKGINLDQAIEFKKNCDKLNILVHGCFMVGFEDETKKMMKNTVRFAKKLNCDSVQFYPVFLYPGTRAYEWAVNNNLLRTKDFSKWLNKKGYHNCVFDLPDITAEEMLRFCEEAYKSYYFSIRYLLKKIFQSVKSIDEAKRNFRAGINFIRYLFC